MRLLSSQPRIFVLLLCASLGSLLSLDAYAQHSDILIQDLDGRVATGSANFEIFVNEVGPRSFQAEFGSAPSGFDCDGTNPFCIELPGFNTVVSTNPSLVSPPGTTAQELPPLTDVEWDFVPMKTNGFSSNLLYWDGSDTTATPGSITMEDVNFGALPSAGYALHLAGQTATIAADGTANLIAGNVIRRTSSSGTIHEHREVELIDGDGNPGTDPIDGIYMAGIRFRVAGLDRSLPGYMVFGTLFPTVDQLDAAFAWVESHEADLAPDFDADFDGDLNVDGSDLATLQQGFGMSGLSALQINGDADFNDIINGADFMSLYRQFGNDLSSFAGVTSPPAALIANVPEPSSLILLGFGAALVFTARRPR